MDVAVVVHAFLLILMVAATFHSISTSGRIPDSLTDSGHDFRFDLCHNVHRSFSCGAGAQWNCRPVTLEQTLGIGFRGG